MTKFFLTAVLCPLLLFADITIERAEKAPLLDGLLSPNEWKAINAEFFAVPCGDGLKAKFPTKLFMQYDDDNLYVAATYNAESGKNTIKDIFAAPRFEFRFGDEKKIDYFVATFNGMKFPSDGWEAVSKDGFMEVSIPLERLNGFHQYRGNVVKADVEENSKVYSSLFPMLKLNFADHKYHQKFFFGTPDEINSALQKANTDRNAEIVKAEKIAAQFRGHKKPSIFGANAAKYQIPETWKPVTLKTGKDFYFMFAPSYGNDTDFSVPGLSKTLPLFRDAAYQVHTWELNQGFRDKKRPLEKLLANPTTSAAGYILRKTDAPIMFNTEGRYSTFEHELQETKENREQFVTEFGDRLLCVDQNESLGPSGGFPMIMENAGLNPKNKKEAYEALKKVALDPARTYIRDWAVFYPELAPFRAPVSATFTDHIYLSFGFIMNGMECGPKTNNMPFSYGVSRGAARQYGRPYRIFLTTHDDMIVFPGWEDASRHYTFNDHRRALRPQTRRHKQDATNNKFSMEGPRYGVPHEDWRRCFIYAFMAGSGIFFDECGHYIMYANYDYKTIEQEDPLAVNLRETKKHLSYMGEMMSDFYDKIVCKEDRGCVYTPIAIVWDLYHGHFSNYHTIPWGLFPSTEGDLMISAMEDSLFPRDRERVYNHRGFRTSKYGDVFDVITNNATEQILDSYPILFFAGDVPIDKALAGKLVTYVRQGGTFVVNWKQIQDVVDLFPGSFFGAKVGEQRNSAQTSYSLLSGRLLQERIPFKYNEVALIPGAGAVILTANERKDPLVISNAFGQGKVLLTMPDFLKERYSKSEMLNIFSDLMLELGRGALPFEVEGDIQFQVHRNKKGWLLSLFNNYGGMDRNWLQPQKKPEPESAVTVTITPKVKYSSVREWFTSEGSLTITVPGGDVRIVEIAE